MTCWSCNKIKGKRVCPARGGELICSKCCGTKRLVEIQCPDDCPYLHGADPNWRSASKQKEDARFLSRYLTLNENQVMFLLFTHHLLLSAGAHFRALSDEELQKVVTTAAKSLETRAKGIVYNHPSGSPHLDRAAEWLTLVLSERANIATAPDVSERDIAVVLDAMGRAIKDHASSSPSARYLDTAEEVLRSSLGGAPPIELPDSVRDLGEASPNLIVPP